MSWKGRVRYASKCFYASIPLHCCSFLNLRYQLFMGIIEILKLVFFNLSFLIAQQFSLTNQPLIPNHQLKAHNDLIKTFVSRLKSFNVPPVETGFFPVRPVAINEASLGAAPAGLVSKCVGLPR